jgi:hypothetical protein
VDEWVTVADFALEEEFGISVDRALETEVRSGIDRVLGRR